MNHPGTIELETKRLLLRRFTVADAEAMFSNWANDPQVTRFLTWQPHGSVETTRAILTDWVASYTRNDYYNWAITLKTDGIPIGNIAVVQQNDDLQLAHIGYCLGKSWWGQGIMSESLTAVMRFLFGEVNVNRIESRHDPNNPASGKVMIKCGLRYEGTAVQADRNNQGIVDAAQYGLIRADYLKKIGGLHD